MRHCMAFMAAAVLLGACGETGDSAVIEGTVFSGQTLVPRVVYYQEEQDFQHTLYITECEEPCTYGCNQLALDFCDPEPPGTYSVDPTGTGCVSSSVSFPPMFEVAKRGTMTVHTWSSEFIDVTFSLDFGEDGALDGSLQTSTICSPNSG